MTQGRLTKEDFTYNEHGYIVSKKKSRLMKTKENPLRKKGLLQNKRVFSVPEEKTYKKKKRKSLIRNDFKNTRSQKGKKGKLVKK